MPERLDQSEDIGQFGCVTGAWEEHIRLNLRERGEFQLTSCLERLRQEDGFTGYVVKGRRYDIGTPEAYRQTLATFQ